LKSLTLTRWILPRAVIIISSHLLHLLEEVCSNVLILKNGRKILDGTLEEIRLKFSELGDASYAKREQAEKRLKDLGRLAIPNLKEALKNKDTEVVMRAERLLLIQKEPLGAE